MAVNHAVIGSIPIPTVFFYMDEKESSFIVIVCHVSVTRARYDSIGPSGILGYYGGDWHVGQELCLEWMEVWKEAVLSNVLYIDRDGSRACLLFGAYCLCLVMYESGSGNCRKAYEFVLSIQALFDALSYEVVQALHEGNVLHARDMSFLSHQVMSSQPSIVGWVNSDLFKGVAKFDFPHLGTRSYVWGYSAQCLFWHKALLLEYDAGNDIF